ncbi:MAG: YceI family protein [Mycobacteriales bacterium]
MTTTSAALPVRLIDGVPLPAAGTWQIDAGHTEVAFIGRHFLLTKIRGRFNALEGAVVIAEDPADSSVSVTIDMASVDSGSVARDEHLRSADHFDVERYPTATYRSTAVHWVSTTGTVDGELTVHGVTRPVTLRVELLGITRDPWDNDKAVFSASAELNREDFGLTWNLPLAAGGLLVSKDIRIEIEMEAVRSE